MTQPPDLITAATAVTRLWDLVLFTTGTDAARQKRGRAAPGGSEPRRGAGEAAGGAGMTDHTLHGNHDLCPACEMRREVQDTAPIYREAIPCNACKGVGFLPLSDAEIVRRTCEEARRVYWPACEARIGGVG